METRGQRLDPHDCIDYYCNQQGGKGTYFASNYLIQRGYGLFSNLKRYAMPIMIKAGKYLGKHLLTTGQNVLEDMSRIKSFREASRNQFRQAGNEIKQDIHRKLRGGVGEFDDVSLLDVGKNIGLKKRWDRVKNGKVFDMCGILHTDLGTQSKLLINGTSIRIRLLKAKNEFALLAAAGDYRIQIENISLYIRKCEISSTILVAHEKALEQSLVQMPFTRTEIKTFTLSSGLKSITIPNAVNGTLPTRMILGLTSNSAYTGDLKKIPFNFKNYKLNHISLTENGTQIPSTAYTPSYGKDLFARNYLSLFTDLAQHKTNITFVEYKENTCLYVFDLTQDFSASDPFANVTRSGDISIHLKFEEDLVETVTLIVYMEMQSLIEIDKSRNVFTDF
ncbi:uncharacterized protein TNCV_2579641 [Trichonephila clavipes]|uniref:Uncharacterized protein n=1 Tax=Trichonephila clavipes TaxID=2585209 RepID=A0A8X6SEV4_TRICX|nr:uncharacterized protein TNCV_2579641 [Trichonephila clavipes]